jgi:uncharacterized protein (TIGR02466 family)
MSDDVPLRQILGPFKEYRHARSKENETTIDEDEDEIVLRTFPVDDISANEFGYGWKVKTVKMAEELLDKTEEVLRSRSKEEVTTRKGIRKSNEDGGYHSTPDFLQRLLALEKEELNKCLGQFLRFVRVHVESFPALKSRRFPMTTSWINKLSTNNSNGLHNHVGAKLSGVFYFDDYEADVDADWREAKEPKPGDLLLRTASAATRKNETVGDWCEYVIVRPQRGKLVLFEPNLLHGVVPSHRERFSLAMNFGEMDVCFEDPNEDGKKIKVLPIDLLNT